MEVYLGNVIRTWRNNQDYWVARVTDGPFKGLSSWQRKKSAAVNLIKETLDEVSKPGDL